MRRWMIPLLAACLLTGCAAAPADPAETENSPPPASAEPAPEAPCYHTVDMVTWEDSAQDGDGTVLAKYCFRMPELTARRADGTAVQEAGTEAEERALASAETFNGQFVPWIGGEKFQELTEMAREERAWRQEVQLEWTSEFFAELDCQVYQTERMVSVAGNYYSYTGGAHPNTVLMAWNFDLGTGAFFEPEQLAEDGGAFSQAVSEEIVRQIRLRAEESGMAAEEMFWSNYEEIAAGWSSYAVFFGESGMTVAFSPYELAAYAAGPQVFCLDNGFLADWLSAYGREVLGLAEEGAAEPPAGT